MRCACRAAALAASLAIALPAALAGADSFTPVRMQITIAGVARREQPLAITVHVSADPEVVNDGGGPVRIQVKLASECGGTYQYTPGVVLLNKQLSPQPGTGAYSATAHGSGKPTAYGVQTVCAFVDNDYQQLANDTSNQVDVSKACTLAAARYDKARRARHPKAATVAADRRRARRACGAGVPL